MNIILLTPDDWLDDRIAVLTDRRHQHVRSVIKAKAGDSLKVGLIGGDRGSGRVLHSDDTETRLEISLDQPAPPRHPCDVVLALPRPKMLRRVLRTIAEMGVVNLHIIHSARVEKSFWQSPLLSPEKVQAALMAGLERSGDTRCPIVSLHRRFRPFVEDQLPELIDNRICCIAHPDAPVGLGTQRSKAIVMLGPEGGFVPFEVELAQSIGAQPVHLGQRILSVDTAVTAALARTVDLQGA
jgi:RsmE family RNA methyltransferase